MTEAKALPKIKKTPEQQLAALVAKQKAVAAKVAKMQKDIEDKKAAANQAQRVHVGKLAAEAGIVDLADDVLRAAFAAIAAKHGIKQADHTAQAEPAVA